MTLAGYDRQFRFFKVKNDVIKIIRYLSDTNSLKTQSEKSRFNVPLGYSVHNRRNVKII
jgi:hypothetical protein